MTTNDDIVLRAARVWEGLVKFFEYIVAGCSLETPASGAAGCTIVASMSTRLLSVKDLRLALRSGVRDIQRVHICQRP